MNLNQATIYSEKTVETVEFFQKLGLNLIVDSLPRYARLECPDGESTLSVIIAKDVVISNNVVLYFECSDLDSKVEELKNFGLEFEEDPADHSWLWRQAYLKGSKGNKICLFYAANRKNPPWRVK